MEPEVRAIFLAVAIVIWIIDQFVESRWRLVSLGLAVAFFPWFWDALDAAG